MKNYNRRVRVPAGMTHQALEFVQAVLLICPPNEKIGQFISTFRPQTSHPAVVKPLMFRIVAADGQLPFPDGAVFQPHFVRHKHARSLKVAFG